MRYAFIEAKKGIYPIRLLCHILRVSRSGYYAWRDRPESRRALESRQLLAHIRRSHGRSRQRYGSPRVWADLRAEGICVGRHRVARLMRQAGLRSRRRRRFRVTTHSRHTWPVAADQLRRDFKASAPNRKWAADITYIPTREGWLYLAVVLDLYSRRIVGWSMASHLNRSLVLDALRMALKRRQPSTRLLHHSDQGGQYASGDYQQLLARHGIQCSMSRRGDCWDNAVVESFFATLKTELIHQTTYDNRDQARRDIFEYIETEYNRQRRHSTLGYLSPVEFERQHAA